MKPVGSIFWLSVYSVTLLILAVAKVRAAIGSYFATSKQNQLELLLDSNHGISPKLATVKTR